MDHDTVAGSDRDLLDWLRLLRDSGVAILRGTPREPLSVLSLACLIGPVRATNFGEHCNEGGAGQLNSRSRASASAKMSTQAPWWATPKMGASGSVLTAMMVSTCFIPARCWTAPEMPSAR